MRITKYLKDTAVYWEYTGMDGFSKPSFAAGTELKVRWEDRQEIFVSQYGSELVSRAIIHVPQTIPTESFFYFGTLSDLTDSQKADPRLVPTAFAVKAYRRLTDLKSHNTLRKVYLYGGEVKD